MKKNLLYLLFLATIMVLCSCSDDADELVFKDQKMFAGDTYEIPDNSWNWSSDNKLIATVSQGVVTAKLVGTTRIHNESGTKSFLVTVKPRHNFYTEPCIQWGATMDAVRTYMSSYTLYSDGDSELTYQGSSDDYFYGYIFTSANQLTSAIVDIRKSALTSDQLLAYLSERYDMVAIGFGEDEEDLFYYFKSIDGKTRIHLIDYHFYPEYFVRYFEYTLSNVPAKKTEIKSLLTGKNHKITPETFTSPLTPNF